MTFVRAGLCLLTASLSVAGCSGFSGFGHAKPQVVVDPNAYPANYRKQIATLLTTSLSSRADFHGTFIAPPVLKQVPESKTPHYVVCLQFTGGGVQKTKVVIYLEGVPNEFVDPTPEECAGAAYQPFTELEAEVPQR